MSRDVHNGRATLNRIGLIPVLLLCLSACGGGGASTSSTSGSSSTGAPAPAMPDPVYSGTQNQGVPDTTTAVGYIQDLFTSLAFVLNNGDVGVAQMERPPNTYNETDQGSTSGTVKLTGVVNPTGTGWIKRIYTNYAGDDTFNDIINGTLIVYPSDFTSGTLGFSHYKQTINGSTIEYNGTIATDGAGKITADLSISDGSTQILLSSFVIDTDTNSDSRITGRLYDSSVGYVTITTPVPATISITGLGQLNSSFDGSGDIQMSGSGGKSLQVEALDAFLEYVGLDTDGDGKIDLGARVDLSTGELDVVQPAGSTVSALAEIDNGVPASGPVMLDGRFSYTPGGYVSYSWQLLAAPLGSVAQLAGSEPTAQFTPDVLGDYLIQLTATAGGKSAIDVIPVNYTGDNPGDYDAAPTRIKVQSYAYSHVGSTVTLDGRASSRIPGNEPGLWTLYTPPGSHAVIADTGAVLTSFTPDVPGIYYATLFTGATFEPVEVMSTSAMIIGVDEAVRLAPPALVYKSVGSIFGLNLGKFGGGGTGDGLAFTTRAITLTGNIQTWDVTGDGLLASEGSTAITSDEMGNILTADLNGDGISDLINPTDSGITDCPVEFRESGVGGYTLSSVALDSSCAGSMFTGASVSSMHSAPIGGHPAVVAAATDYGSSRVSVFATFLEDNSGVMQSPVITTLGGGVSSNSVVLSFQLQDIDGDNKADLVAAIATGSGVSFTYTLQIYHGNDDGTFTYVTAYTPSGAGSIGESLQLGDFNGDGKLDIALANADTLNLFYGDGTGNFSTTPDTRSIEGPTPYLVALDLNNDGHPDLVVSEGSCGNPSSHCGMLGMYVSDSSGLLGQELFYPLFNTNFNLGLPTTFSEGIKGDFNGDGQQDLMMDVNAFGNLVYMPQVLAITSATITSVSNRAKEALLPRAPMMKHDSLKLIGTARISAYPY